MNILVTTDGSEQSLCILPHALRFARLLGADVTLAQVFEPAWHPAAPSERDALLKTVLRTHGVSGDVLTVEQGEGENVAGAIRRAADAIDAVAIAMATHGRGAIGHAIFGSVALDVVSKASLPVMVLTGCPPAPGGDGPLHVLVTYDGSEDARRAVEGITRLLVPGKTKVTLFEVAIMSALETESEADDRVRGPLERLAAEMPDGLDCDVRIQVVPPAAGVDTAIAVTAKELGVDAIAMATHGHSARRHLVAGSVALGVVKQSQVPVVLVRSQPPR